MSVDNKLMGEAVRRLRELRGLTQAQLAKAAGLSSGGNSVALIERGLRGVSLNTLESLAGALEVPSACLLILGKRSARRSGAIHDLLDSMQRLVVKLVELHSVLKAEEAAGTFKPTRGKKSASMKPNPPRARKAASRIKRKAQEKQAPVRLTG